MNVILKSRLWLMLPPMAAMVVACSGGSLSSVAPGNQQSGVGAPQTRVVRAVPAWLHGGGEPRSPRALAHRPLRKGIYTSAFSGTYVLGFTMAGKGPKCLFNTGDTGINDIAVDPKGNLIVPIGSTETVNVYQGPNMCGTEAGSFSDPYGQPSDAATMNALTGTIVVGNIVGSGGYTGNVAICTLKGGCKKELTNPNIIGYVGSVALAKNGDCWATSDVFASYYVSPPTMTFWKGCTGSGEAVTGYQNKAYGSISIDSHGYLVSLDLGGVYGSDNSQLWVYKGCSPNCKLVGGPFPLHGHTVFGALNQKSDEYGVTNYLGGSYPYTMTDIYSYSPTKVAYKFGFQNREEGADPEGFAFSPSLKL
jgi:hypothetical protein